MCLCCATCGGVTTLLANLVRLHCNVKAEFVSHVYAPRAAPPLSAVSLPTKLCVCHLNQTQPIHSQDLGRHPDYIPPAGAPGSMPAPAPRPRTSYGGGAAASGGGGGGSSRPGGGSSSKPPSGAGGGSSQKSSKPKTTVRTTGGGGGGRLGQAPYNQVCGCWWWCFCWVVCGAASTDSSCCRGRLRLRAHS